MQIYQLRKEDTTPPTKDYDSHRIFCKAQALWDNYQKYVPIPVCGCEETNKIIQQRDDKMIYQLFMGLNSKYGVMRSQTEYGSSPKY